VKRYRWKDKIKINLVEVGHQDVDWIWLRIGVQCKALVNTLNETMV
jgi:hypothetical protein